MHSTKVFWFVIQLKNIMFRLKYLLKILVFISKLSESYEVAKKKLTTFCITSTTEVENVDKSRKRKKKQFFDSSNKNTEYTRDIELSKGANKSKFKNV